MRTGFNRGVKSLAAPSAVIIVVLVVIVGRRITDRFAPRCCFQHVGQIVAVAHVAYEVSLVHRRVRFVLLVSLGILLLLPDGDAVAQHPQKLRLEFVLVGLATDRGNCREDLRAQRQHVIRRGAVQDRVDRLEPRP
jgi:hypothetical protein